MKKCCCPPDEVYGLTCNAPNLTPTQSFSILGYFTDDSANGAAVLPDVGDPAGSTGTEWTFGAARVPSAYPYGRCEKDPVFSSADPRAAEKHQWQVQLGIAGEKITYTDGFDVEHIVYGNLHKAFSSRAIYVDGYQRKVVYAITPNHSSLDSPDVDDPGWSAPALIKDHVQINIAGQSSVLQRAENGDLAVADETVMEFQWRTFLIADDPLQDTYYPENSQLSAPPAWQCFGDEYFIISTYTPGATDWSVGRLKYEGREVFCTPKQTVNTTSDFVGDYLILLPAIRCYIDSTATQPDECWVAALNADGNKLVLGQWFNTDLRDPGGTTMDDGVADGSLRESERSVTVVDGSSPPAEFPDEPFANIELRCNNRIQHPGMPHPKQLLLFTSDPPEGTATTDSPLADFEQGITPDFHYLDHGIEDDGLHFETGGSEAGNEWLADSTQAHGGTYSAKANINAVFDTVCDLWIEINVTTTGSTLTCWYMFDNRGSGTRIPGFAFNELTNFPIVDNTLTLLVEGAPVPILIDGVSYDTSIIDNENVPSGNPHNDEAFYLTWKQVTVTLDAGARSIRWSLHRRIQDNFGRLDAWVDDMQFPEIQVGDDINSKRRWFWDDVKVRRAKWWKFPKRDDDAGTNIASRVSTLPDFITMDSLGRIIYGNAHYVVVLKYDSDSDEWAPDEDFIDGGIWAFTASPLILPPAEYQNGDCEWVAVLDTNGSTDQIKDPIWPAYQILATEHGFQLRGANGTWGDASHNPLNTASYENDGEEFIRVLNAGAVAGWNSRIQGWTFSEDGKTRLPHVEVIWRCNYDQPSWPFEPPYTNAGSDPGPYHPDTEADSYLLAPDGTLDPNFARWRDPRRLTGMDARRKPQWVDKNKIVSRVYCDSYSRRPQFKWTVNPNPDPEPLIGGDPNPDYENPPWPRAQARIHPAYLCPTAGHWEGGVFVLEARCTDTEHAGDEECQLDPEHGDTTNICWHYNVDYAVVHSGFTDFEAVYGATCRCCADPRVDRPGLSTSLLTGGGDTLSGFGLG
jgi:hypothetical protein